MYDIVIHMERKNKLFYYFIILFYYYNLNNPNYVPFDRSEQIRYVQTAQKHILAEQVETEALTNTGPGGQSIWDR